MQVGSITQIFKVQHLQVRNRYTLNVFFFPNVLIGFAFLYGLVFTNYTILLMPIKILPMNLICIDLCCLHHILATCICLYVLWSITVSFPYFVFLNMPRKTRTSAMDAHKSFENYKYMYNCNTIHTPYMEPYNVFNNKDQRQLHQNNVPYYQSTNLGTTADSGNGGRSSNVDTSTSNPLQQHLHVSHEKENLLFGKSTDNVKYSNDSMCNSRKRKISLAPTLANYSDKKQKGIIFLLFLFYFILLLLFF